MQAWVVGAQRPQTRTTRRAAKPALPFRRARSLSHCPAGCRSGFRGPTSGDRADIADALEPVEREAAKERLRRPIASLRTIFTRHVVLLNYDR